MPAFFPDARPKINFFPALSPYCGAYPQTYPSEPRTLPCQVRSGYSTSYSVLHREMHPASPVKTLPTADTSAEASFLFLYSVHSRNDRWQIKLHIPSDRYVQNPLPSTRNIFHSFCRLFLLSGQTYPQSPHWKMRISFPPDEEMSGKAV